VRSDAVLGTLALRGLASLRRWRRHGSRFAEEQAAIERWLGAISGAARDDPQCALELARCGRLIKGYGETNERGKRSLAHVLDQLLARPFATPADRARAIAEAREAALGDEGGGRSTRLSPGTAHRRARWWRTRCGSCASAQ